MQCSRDEVRDLTSFDNVESTAVDHPNLSSIAGVKSGLLLFGETGIEPGEVVCCTDPHDAREDVYPPEREVEPFAEGGIQSHGVLGLRLGLGSLALKTEIIGHIS